MILYTTEARCPDGILELISLQIIGIQLASYIDQHLHVTIDNRILHFYLSICYDVANLLITWSVNKSEVVNLTCGTHSVSWYSLVYVVRL